MAQMQAQAYIQDGRLFTNGLLGKIPTDRTLKLTIAWDEEEPAQAETKTKSERQGEAFDKFIKVMQEHKEQGIEPLDDEFFEIVNSGTSVREAEL